MIQVSDQFKQAVYAPIRKTTAKVKFEILDNEAYGDKTITVTGEAPISRTDQLTNKIRSMTRKYATFEHDYFKLDGSFYIPPAVDEGDSELGWWSEDICGADGLFFIPQELEFVFQESHNSMGLTITFDPKSKEWASDFIIDVYRFDGTLIWHEEITDNNNPIYLIVRGLDNYRRIVITIKKWAKPYRRARVTEVDFGIVQEYADDKLIKLNLIEEINVTGSSIPANEMKFTIDNSSREFNVLNPEGFYRFLRERQEVEASIGVEVAPEEFMYVDFKKYYLTDWQSDEGALTTSFTARNVFELLEQVEYAGSGPTTLYALAQDVFTQAGVASYEIDPALRRIDTGGFSEKLTARKALQHIGIAGMATVYQDRSGVVHMKQLVGFEDGGYLEFAGETVFCGEAYPAVRIDSDYDMKNITFDNIYKEPQVNLDKLLKTIVIVIYDEGRKEEINFNNSGVKEGVTLKCDNPLINTFEHARKVAGWIIEESNLRALYTINWRQNPVLECGDIVLVEDSFNAKKKSRILKQEYEYQGYLSGKTESKGGV